MIFVSGIHGVGKTYFCNMIEKKLGIKNNSRGKMKTFTLLKPDTMILLLQSPKIIAERRYQRDGIRQDECIINDFQEAEKAYATEIARQLNIPLVVSGGASDLGRIMELIKMGGC